MSEIHFFTFNYWISYFNGMILFHSLKDFKKNYNSSIKIIFKIISYSLFHLFISIFLIIKQSQNYIFYSYENYIISNLMCALVFSLSSINLHIRNNIMKIFLKLSMISYLFKFYLMFNVNAFKKLKSIFKFIYFIIVYFPFCYGINKMFI